MGKIYNTCGHSDANGSHFVAIKYFDREGKRSISYRTVCSSCLIEHEAAGELLHTSGEEVDWLLGGEPTPENYAIIFSIDDQDTYWKQL
jgi:hypothetical protein